MPVHRRERRCSGSADFHSHWKQSCPNYIQPFALRQPETALLTASPRKPEEHLTSKAGIQTPQRLFRPEGRPRENTGRGSRHHGGPGTPNTPPSLAEPSKFPGGVAQRLTVPKNRRQSQLTLRAPTWTKKERAPKLLGLQLAPQITLRGQSDPKREFRHSRRHTDRHQNLGHAAAVKNYSRSCQHRLRSIIRNGDTQYPFSTSGETTKTSRPWDLSVTQDWRSTQFPSAMSSKAKICERWAWRDRLSHASFLHLGSVLLCSVTQTLSGWPCTVRAQKAGGMEWMGATSSGRALLLEKG